MSSDIAEQITGTLVAMAPIPIDDDTRRWASATADQIIQRLNLRAETVPRRR